MQWLDDMSAADWIASTLHPSFSDQGSILPPIYEAYARVFHPLDGGGRWSELADRNGRVAHGSTQLHLIGTPAGETPTTWFPYVFGGSSHLPEALRLVLIEHLSPFTPVDEVLIAWDTDLETFNARSFRPLPFPPVSITSPSDRSTMRR